MCFPKPLYNDKGHPDESPDGFYRTVFGPSVPHAGVTFCKCNDCVKLALRRVTCVRAPYLDTLGDSKESALEHENRFRNNQVEFLSRVDVKALLRRWLEVSEYDHYVDIQQAIRQFAGDKHPKRMLRLQARKELEETGDIQDRLYLKSVHYKLKTQEIGKPGKLPRMIGDLGVAASLQGFKITEILKHAMHDNQLVVNGMTCEVVIDPRPETLTAIFEKLINPPGRGYFCAYSDDSCLSMRIGGRVRIFNLDIAACDTSHTPLLFETLKNLVPLELQDDMQILIDQCSLPIRIIDENNPKRSVLLSPSGPVLYSGSTLTTVINNLANTTIFISIATSDISQPADIALAAERAGYVVTGTDEAEECEVYQKIQFLKHSPVYDTNGILRPMKNLGVLLRSMGCCKYDLPGRGDLRVRAKQFMKGFLHGTYPNTKFTFIATLKSHFEDATPSEQMERFVQQHLGFHQPGVSTDWEVSDEEYLKRYDLYQHEIDELNECAKYATLESVIDCTGITRIMELDYGLNMRYDDVYSEPSEQR
mgnify:CR=1 FL=1